MTLAAVDASAPVASCVEYGETGLTFPRELTFDEWQALGATLGRMAESVMFWLGDWWLWGEHHYGEAAAQAAPTGYATGTLQEAARVADRIPSPRRLGSLSWSHHQAVAALDEPAQDALLGRAVAEHLSVRDLRHEAARAKALTAPEPSPGDILAAAGRELRECTEAIEAASARRATAWARWAAVGVTVADLARMSGVTAYEVRSVLGERGQG